MVQNRVEGPTLEAPPPLEIYYMKLTEDQVDARLGKMRAGKIVSIDKAQAVRWLTAGIAEQVPYGEYAEQQERREMRLSARQERFQQLNQSFDVWDVSTYRDVLTAPDKGLRIAFERGISLVNVHMLRDEDGDPLPPDADIEEILEARQSLHADLTAPLAAHDRSSVMGGGSPYQQNYSVGPMPLNPQHREMAERLAQNDPMARPPAALDLDRDSSFPPGPPNAAQRRARTLQGQAVRPTLNEGPTNDPPGPPAPPPPRPGSASTRRGGKISPEAQGQADIHDVPPPQQATGEQVGN